MTDQDDELSGALDSVYGGGSQGGGLSSVLDSVWGAGDRAKKRKTPQEELESLSSTTTRRFGREEKGVNVAGEQVVHGDPHEGYNLEEGPEDVRRQLAGEKPRTLLERLPGMGKQAAAGAAESLPWLVPGAIPATGASFIYSAAREAVAPSGNPDLADGEHESYFQRVRRRMNEQPVSRAMAAATGAIGEQANKIVGEPESQLEAGSRIAGGLVAQAKGATFLSKLRGGGRGAPVEAPVESAPIEEPAVFKGPERRGEGRMSDEEYFKLTGETPEARDARRAADETLRMPAPDPAELEAARAQREAPIIEKRRAAGIPDEGFPDTPEGRRAEVESQGPSASVQALDEVYGPAGEGKVSATLPEVSAAPPPHPAEIAPAELTPSNGKAPEAAPEAAPSPETPAPEQEPQVAPERRPTAEVGGVAGRTDRVKLSDQTSHQVEYRWLPLEEAHGSINPETLQPTAPERFRPAIQQRTYDRASLETLASKEPNQRLDADRVLDPTRSIEAGPPTVTKYGEAVSGTERLTRIKRAAIADPEAYAEYQARAKEDAVSFGIDPAKIDGPGVLVRVLTDPALNQEDTGLLSKLNERSDKTLTKLKGRFAEGVGRAGRLRDAETAGTHLADTIGPDQSVRDYLGTGQGKEFVTKLATEGVIDASEKAAYLKGGSVTEEGKQLIENMLRGAAFGDVATLDRAPPSALNKFDPVLGSIAKTGGMKGLELQPHLKDAMNLLADARDQGVTVHDMVNQGDMLRAPDPATGRLAQFIDDSPRNAVTGAIRRYTRLADEAVKQGEAESMFGDKPATGPEILDRVLRESKTTEGGFVLLPVLLRTVGAAGGGVAGAQLVDDDDPWWQKALKIGTGALVGFEAGSLGKGAYKKGVDVRDAIRRIADPAARSADAKTTANLARGGLGEMARSYEQAEFALKGYRDQLGKMPAAQTRAFIDNIEGGAPQGNPLLDKPAKELRRILDEKRSQIQSLGTGKLASFYTDYFPHIWKDPAKAATVADQLAQRRPLEGSKNFLKQRTYMTMGDGLAAGLEPVSENPVDLTMLKIREMDRYIMATKLVQDLESRGLMKTVQGRNIPQGWAKIDDKIGTVFGKPVMRAMKGQGAAPAAVITGYRVAPEAVARVINNHLSPGLRGNAIYDAYMSVGNTLNQAQLGLSAFHLGFTSMEAVVSKVALSTRQAVRGDILSAGKSLAKAATAPITNVITGAKLRRAYLAPGSQGTVFAAMADHLESAGGRVNMDSFYRNGAASKFRQAIADRRLVPAAWHGFAAVLEKASKPVLEYIVPRQKLGVFYDLASEELARLPSGAGPDQVQASMARAWDSADNRLGQMVYDNLFWDRTLKDVAMATTRSVGWNLGTFRELGGGMKDLASGKLSAKASYVVALPLTTALVGAAYNYMATGEGPQELKDYFYPRSGHTNPDGSEERVQLPTYMKDVMAYGQHPVETLGHKLHPGLAAIADMLHNEDYYGDKIRNEEDPFVEQVKQVGTYMAKQFVPFAVANAQEEGKRGQGVGQKALPFIGVTPAPRSATRTDAENRMMKIFSRTRQSGASPEEAERRDDITVAIRALREGDTDTFRRVVGGSQLSTGDVARVIKRAQQDPWVERFKRLSVDDAQDVFDRANDEERGRYAPVLMAKLLRAGKAAGKTAGLQGLLQPDQ